MRSVLILLVALFASLAAAQTPGPMGEGQFVNISGDKALVGTVYALVRASDGTLYAGGAFSVGTSSVAVNVARQDGSGWVAVGGGTDGRVNSLAVASDGTLYAGGSFATAGGVAARSVARWDGAAWSPLGSGVYGSVTSVAVAPDGVLYAGGAFSAPGLRVARWDGTSWSALGGGISGLGNNSVGVSTVAVAPDGTLYVGGQFFTAGGVSVANVAQWDGTAWARVGNGLGGPYSYYGVFSLTVADGGTLYAGGQFSLRQNEDVAVAQWNGRSWSKVGDGITGSIGNRARAVALSDDGTLYVAGELDNASTLGSVRRWDGTAWTALPQSPSRLSGSTLIIRALAGGPGAAVAVGGEFGRVGGGGAPDVADWDGTAWRPISGTFDGSVSDLAQAPDGTVYAVGGFRVAGGVQVTSVARYRGGVWSGVGGGVTSNSGGISAVDVAADGRVYAGGVFTEVGGVLARNVAVWDGTAWAPLGAGLDGRVYGVAVAPDGSVYAAGTFTEAGGVPARNVARWSPATQTWSALGVGTDGRIEAVAVAPDGSLYAAGEFTTAGAVFARKIARWDGAAWSALGAGLQRTSGVAYASALGIAADGTLYAGGRFDEAGGVQVRNVARWDGAAWSSLGIGVDDTVNAIAVAGTSVYVGGDFAEAGGMAASRLARWDGAAWFSPDGEFLPPRGLNSSYVEALLSGSAGDLYVGGSFSGVGAVESAFITLLDVSGTVAEAPGPSATGALSVSVGPNPARGGAAAFVTAPEGPVSVSVLDLLGRVVGRAEALSAGASMRVALPVAGLAPGVYVVRVAAGASAQSVRLVVAR